MALPLSRRIQAIMHEVRTKVVSRCRLLGEKQARPPRRCVYVENRYRKSNIFTNCTRHVKINEYAINLLHGNNEAEGISMNITSHLPLPPPCT